MAKVEVVRKAEDKSSRSQFVDVPDGQDPWVFAASYMKNEDVKSVAVHVLPPPGTVDQG